MFEAAVGAIIGIVASIALLATYFGVIRWLGREYIGYRTVTRTRVDPADPVGIPKLQWEPIAPTPDAVGIGMGTADLFNRSKSPFGYVGQLVDDMAIEFDRAEQRNDEALARSQRRHETTMAAVEETLTGARQPRNIKIRDK